MLNFWWYNVHRKKDWRNQSQSYGNGTISKGDW